MKYWTKKSKSEDFKMAQQLNKETSNENNKFSKKDQYFLDLEKIEKLKIENDKKIILSDSLISKNKYRLSFYFKLKAIKLNFNLKYYFYQKKVQKVTRKTLSLSSDNLLGKIFSKLLDIFILIVVGIIILFPFYWMIITSFKTHQEVSEATNQTIWPKVWSLQAYKEMFKVAETWQQYSDVSFARIFTNSVIVAVLSTVLQLFVALLGGFAIYNWKTKINPLILIIMLSIMMIPGEALLMGRFVLVDRLGWQDNILALVVPFIGNVFSIYLVNNAFTALGSEVRRASKVDGLSNFQYFIKIATPAISATLVTAFITGLIGSWNSILWPITIIDQNGQWQTIPMFLYKFINITGEVVGGGAQNNPINVKMAACVICILPMIIMFVVFNRPIINGLTRRTGGGNKG